MSTEELIGKLQMVYVGDKNALNEMIDYYDELFDEMESWREESKELNKKYLNAVADYETTMSELQEIKKLLEEKNKPQIFIDAQDIEERYAEGLYQDYLEEENKKYKNQQKEFIDYLENMLDNENDIFSVVRVKDVLSKYKEIIGDNK